MHHNRLVQYFIDSYNELLRVVWPTRNRAINICILVVSFVLISAAVIAAVDFIFNTGYTYLLTLAR